MGEAGSIEIEYQGEVNLDEVLDFPRKNIMTFCFQSETTAREALAIIREQYLEDPLSSIKGICLAEAVDKEQITFPFWVGVFFQGRVEGAVDDWICSTGIPRKADEMCFGEARYYEFLNYSRPALTYVFRDE